MSTTRGIPPKHPHGDRRTLAPRPHGQTGLTRTLEDARVTGKLAIATGLAPGLEDVRVTGRLPDIALVIDTELTRTLEDARVTGKLAIATGLGPGL
ncbi:hypothetical protein GCM10022226_71410 [Sphaerisporangium flaviroseum]|uniref:Uncharacterized protein n=1 Tax=Sphaerisporangium flaviroseum TaxID=509199 RepID=A0ABP7JA03_9ACTN